MFESPLHTGGHKTKHKGVKMVKRQQERGRDYGGGKANRRVEVRKDKNHCNICVKLLNVTFNKQCKNQSNICAYLVINRVIPLP